MGEVGSDADRNGLVAGPEGGYAGRDNPDADFPGAPVPVGNALPGWVFIDVLPIQDRADDAACCGAMVKQALLVRRPPKVAKGIGAYIRPRAINEHKPALMRGAI